MIPLSMDYSKILRYAGGGQEEPVGILEIWTPQSMCSTRFVNHACAKLSNRTQFPGISSFYNVDSPKRKVRCEFFECRLWRGSKNC
jgi:hypothetical protein